MPGDTIRGLEASDDIVRQGSCFRLLCRSALRYSVQGRWQTLLNILGIMVGVMMVVAVDLANNSARQSFDASLAILNGQITHQINAGSRGIPDTLFTRLKTELGLQKAAPSLSGQISINNRELTLLGIDVISEGAMQRNRPGLPDQAFSVSGNFILAIGSSANVVMETSLAQSLGLRVGDTFDVRRLRGTTESARQATLAAVFNSPNTEFTGELILADIAAAQYFLDRPGFLDTIDLVLDNNAVSQLQTWLPAGLVLVEANTRNDNLRQMSEAFHINLLAMSLLSLLVAGLLIYNTVTLSVMQRQKTLGIFRALGVSRMQVFCLVMFENGVVGLVASVLGVGAGFVLGSFLVTLVTATVDSLYLNLTVTNFFVAPTVLLKGLVLGIILSLVSAALPAIHAARCLPVTLQHQVAGNNQWQKTIHLLALPGIIFLASGCLLLLPDYGSLVTGFVALTLLVFGFCLLVPLCLYWLLSALLMLTGKWAGLPGVMALRNARLAINRTGLAVAALCVAVSVTVGVGVMVGSFRGTVILWLDQSLPGDIQITAVSSDAQAQGFPEEMIAALSDIEGLVSMHYSTLEQVESEFGPVRLGANDIPATDRFYIKEVMRDGLADFDAGRSVFISEPLSYLQNVQLNDSISLLTDNGMMDFMVSGIFYDYTSGSPLVQMHDSLYQRHWSQHNVMRLTLDFDAQTNATIVEDAVGIIVDNQSQQFTRISNRQLRQLTLQIFDRTFAITNVLRLLAILVAFIGVVSTLMALQLEKFREFAILRATGMTPIQIVWLILKQTTVLGVCAGLLAIPLGLLMSEVLIDVINKRSFGWSMQHFLPESVLIEAFALAVGAALLAGLYPAWRATRIKPVLALREE